MLLRNSQLFLGQSGSIDVGSEHNVNASVVVCLGKHFSPADGTFVPVVAFCIEL